MWMSYTGKALNLEGSLSDLPVFVGDNALCSDSNIIKVLMSQTWNILLKIESKFQIQHFTKLQILLYQSSLNIQRQIFLFLYSINICCKKFVLQLFTYSSWWKFFWANLNKIFWSFVYSKYEVTCLSVVWQLFLQLTNYFVCQVTICKKFKLN